MTFIIPNQSTKKHGQYNKNDLSGTIYQSRNISLDEEGYIKLAETPYAVMTTDDDADLDTADAMYPMKNEVYVNSDYVFRGRIGNSTLYNTSGDTNTPSPRTEDDLLAFNGVEVVSDGTTIKYQASPGTWTTITGTSLPSTFTPTVMTVWDAANHLVIGKDNKVKFVDTSWVVSATTLTLPSSYQVSSMTANGTQLFIGTRSKSGGEAKMFVANTISTAATSAYGAGTFEIASLKNFKSSVVAITTLGQLLRFNGGGFDELASLPIYATGLEWADALNDYSTVSNRAMTTDGDLIYINLSAFTTDGRYKMIPEFPSGIWCYDDTNKSLYHRYSPSYTRLLSLPGAYVTVSTTNNNFTLTINNLNSVTTGMPVIFDSGNSPVIPELKQSVVYYIIKDSSTVFRLAETYADAVAGNAIDITNAGNTSQEFTIFKTNDYGWAAYDNRMAVCMLNDMLFDNIYSGRIAYTAELASKQYLNSKRTVIGAVCPYLPNRGYFVTPRLNSSEVSDHYNNFVLKFRPLKDGEEIIVKYKTKDRVDSPKMSIEYNQTDNWYATWSNTTTFTTSTQDLSDVEVGDEIEIIGGVGSGHIAHVSSITENSGTYTVVLDEGFPFAASGDRFYYIVDNFTKLTTITSDNADGYYRQVVDSNGKFIQFKVEMRGIGVTIEELQIDNKYLLPTKA